jgi:hypothetical protein
MMPDLKPSSTVERWTAHSAGLVGNLRQAVRLIADSPFLACESIRKFINSFHFRPQTPASSTDTCGQREQREIQKAQNDE